MIFATTNERRQKVRLMKCLDKILRIWIFFRASASTSLNCWIRPLKPACLPRDTHVFEQGQLSDYLYILTSGKVIIRYKPYDGPPLTVATIGPGGVFGWSAALGGRCTLPGRWQSKTARLTASESRLVESVRRKSGDQCGTDETSGDGGQQQFGSSPGGNPQNSRIMA